MTRSEAIGHLKNIAIYSVQDGYTDEARQALDMAIKALEEPERKMGRWIKEHWHSDHVRQCSACHVTQTVTTYSGIVNFKFCPYCGADMRGEQNERDS